MPVEPVAGSPWNGWPDVHGIGGRITVARAGKHPEVRAAAQEAWQRLGDKFLATWPSNASKPVPWAQEAFGEPQGGPMPIKRRASKARRYRISPEAAERWRQVRPHGLHFACQLSPAAGVDDELLGDLVGEPAWLAMRPEDLQALFAALEDAIGAG